MGFDRALFRPGHVVRPEQPFHCNRKLHSRTGIGREQFFPDCDIQHTAEHPKFLMHRTRLQELMRRQVEAWQKSELTDVTAKVVIYEAFVEGRLEAPKHMARTVHDLYFEPRYEEFRPRTIWSLSNAFTSAFKELEPVPQFKATAKLGEFLETRFSQSF